MPDAIAETQLIELLKSIGAKEPEPWYPAAHARATGTNRDSLDAPLNELRSAGLVRMTDWQSGVGQGYHVTVEGRRVMARPELITKRRPIEPIVEQPVRTPQHDVPVTRLLVIAQAGAFLLGLIQVIEKSGSINQYLTDGRGLPLGMGQLIETLGVSRVALHQGAWWTLLTYALVHAGVPHLGMNLLGLLFDGRQAEVMYGWWKFLVLYLISVFAGGIVAVLSSPHGLTVGSSGGWCGVVAAETVWVLLDRHLLTAADRQRWMTNFGRVVILMVAISLVPGVSWGGHLGGAIGGGISAWLLLQLNSRQQIVRLMSIIGLVLLPLAAGLGLWYWLR
jgi:membrane associated rhomboid family serine protease